MNFGNSYFGPAVRREFIGMDINAAVGIDQLRMLLESPKSGPPRSTNWKVHFKRALDSFPLLASGNVQCLYENNWALDSATHDDELIGCRLFGCLINYSCQQMDVNDGLTVLGRAIGWLEHADRGAAFRNLKMTTVAFYVKILLQFGGAECASDLCDAWLDEYPHPRLHLFRSFAAWVLSDDAEALRHANLVLKYLHLEENESVQQEMAFCNVYNMGAINESKGDWQAAEDRYQECLSILSETSLRQNWERIINLTMASFLAARGRDQEEIATYASKAVEIEQRMVELAEAIDKRAAQFESEQNSMELKHDVRPLGKTKLSIDPQSRSLRHA